MEFLSFYDDYTDPIHFCRSGTVSGSNFSIPSFPRYEFNVFDEGEMKLDQLTDKHNSKDSWQVIDLSDRAKSVSSADSKNNGEL